LVARRNFLHARWQNAWPTETAWQEHVRRGIAIGIAVSFHLLVLLLILYPEMYRQNAKADQPDMQRLQLRFLRPQVTPSRHMTVPGLRKISAGMHAHAKQKALPSKPATIEHVPSTVPMVAGPIAPDAVVAPTGNSGADGDGGFHQRLLQAQQPSVTRDVPGSDVSRVPGIRLIDPDTQGVRAVTRKLQRLFGITSRHCIDVEVWRNLTPRQLSERHMSSGDLDHLDEEYHCNEPKGLGF
jgi:hypothetical protein